MPDKMSIELVKHSDGDIRMIVTDGRVKQHIRCDCQEVALGHIVAALVRSSVFCREWRDDV